MKVTHRRTLYPTRPFTPDEHRGLGMLAITVYAVMGAATLMWLGDHSSASVKEALDSSAAGWAFLLGLVPFIMLFPRALHRLLRPLLRQKWPAKAEESPPELALWASAVLDKKRSP